jgi:hypothetical protein
MAEPNQLPAIVPANDGDLSIRTGPQGIVNRMADSVLDVARAQARELISQRRYKIGDYEFREADHEQIQRWARMLGITAEKMVKGLKSLIRACQKFCVQGITIHQRSFHASQ